MGSPTCLPAVRLAAIQQLSAHSNGAGVRGSISGGVIIGGGCALVEVHVLVAAGRQVLREGVGLAVDERLVDAAPEMVPAAKRQYGRLCAGTEPGQNVEGHGGRPPGIEGGGRVLRRREATMRRCVHTCSSRARASVPGHCRAPSPSRRTPAAPPPSSPAPSSQARRPSNNSRGRSNDLVAYHDI